MGQTPRELTPYVSLRHFFGAELRRWRERAGLSHSRLGAQINYSGDLIGKVEKAERAPTAALAKACDEVLDTGGALERLVVLIEATVQEAHAPGGSEIVLPVVGCLLAGHGPTVGGSSARGEDPVNRLGFLVSLFGTGAGALVGLESADVSRLGPEDVVVLPVPERVDRAHVRYLQVTLARLRDQHHTVGGGGVLPRALRLFAQARRMLDESDYTAAVGRELLVVTADLGIESAWFAFDADNQPLARRLNEEAALLADSASAGEQCVHLYVNMVHQGTYLARHTGRLGFAREALRFADRAADAVRHEPSPALHAFVSLRQALAHAQLGDEVAFRSAISTARRELDRGPHDTDPTWTQFLGHSEITSIEAGGSVHLGAPARAVRLYQLALDNSARSPRDEAITRSKLAETLVAAGDLDQAIAQSLMILPDLGTTLSSGVVLQQLRPVREAAGATAATEFCERFDAAARALRSA